MRGTTGTLLLALLCVLSSCSRARPEERPPAGLAGTVIVDPPSDIEMVYIPGGSFTMGSYNADDEQPPHEVRLGGFYIGKYEITQRQWQTIMSTNPSQHVGEQLPVESVSWEDARTFTERLSEMTGKTYRLPTEAEWEYAARAGSTTDFHFGNDTLMLGAYAWYEGNSDGTTHPVGLKQPNAWGLYDMAGNVWEWCEDWWDPDYYDRSARESPVNRTPYLYTSPITNEQFVVRVARSGSYANTPPGLESAHRHGGRPDIGRHIHGFRVVRVFERSVIG